MNKNSWVKLQPHKLFDVFLLPDDKFLVEMRSFVYALLKMEKGHNLLADPLIEQYQEDKARFVEYGKKGGQISIISRGGQASVKPPSSYIDIDVDIDLEKDNKNKGSAEGKTSGANALQLDSKSKVKHKRKKVILNKPISAEECNLFFRSHISNEPKADSMTQSFLDHYKLTSESYNSDTWKDQHGNDIVNWKLKAMTWIRREQNARH